MNPFKVFQEVKQQYKAYIQTFQIFKNKQIRSFVNQQVEDGNMLWQEPIVQISKRFKTGETLRHFVNEGILHPAIENVFQLTNEHTGDHFMIHPHLHQDQAITIVSGRNENLVVTTGTGSGKSLCFEIPIVNHCLKAKDDGKQGIKAIIIYPMNALANSQYQELSKKLAGSGLTIGLYTGDTALAPEEALEKYKEIFGPDAVPNDSEVISRSQMKKTPPDILLTNYVQLELLLTRLEDKPLFLDEFKENLRFLVLDELHTYSGKQGADVAFLVRRLKQRTNTIGKLICIGTSATMVSDKSSEDSGQAVADFAAKMFGEPFKGENVVVETEDLSLEFEGELISETYSLNPEDIELLDHEDILTSRSLFKALMGYEFAGTTNLELGEALKSSRLLSFLEKELKEVKDFGTLTDNYRNQIRHDLTPDQCRSELVAGLLLGIAGTLQTDTGKEVSRFIPKVHAFYNQGGELRGCLEPDCKYLSHTGETTCPKCELEERGERTLYPLHFCRVCGQEYYGLSWDKNSGKTAPWTFMDYEAEGNTGYYSPTLVCNEEDLPANWFTPVKKEHRKTHLAKFPINGELDTESNILTKYWPNEEDKSGVFIPSPLPICLSCLTEHTGNTSEYAKLFLLNSIGRATGTDVITTASINASPTNEKKLIGFSDNRQDTAFQAGHLNHWYSQIYFRRILNKVLQDFKESVIVKDLPAKLFPLMIDVNKFKPVIRRQLREKFETYLETFLFVEIRGTKKFTSINLEDVGLLEIGYDSLFESISEMDQNYTRLMSLSENKRYDLIKGFFEIFRREVAVGHPNLMDKANLRTTYDFIENYIPDHRIFEAVEETRASIYSNASKDHFRGSNLTHHSLNNSFTIRTWIRKCIPEIDTEMIDSCLNEILSFGIENTYLQSHKYHGQEFFTLNPDIIMVRSLPDGFSRECPKCHSQYNWKVVDACLKNSCKNGLEPAVIHHDFYYDQYTQSIEGSHIIVADDHSAQVSGQERKIKENKFKKTPPEIQILFATPTMELGIDIGTLSSVYMRNVPPNPSNYAQRAGRAGRSGQGSIIQTFCGSGPGRGTHDQYFYNHPTEIVAGKIAVPRFNLDNESLFLSHINALILQTIDVKLPAASKDIIDFADPALEMYDSKVDEFSKAILTNRLNILSNIDLAFRDEIAEASTINNQAIGKQVDDFIFNLNEAFTILREDYKESKDEIKRLTKKIQEEGGAYNFFLTSRREALEKRNESLREGGEDFYMYRYLSQVGFLPNYAFPTKIKSVKFQYQKEEKELVRDQIIALREFSPYNTLYYSGQKFVIERVSRESDINTRYNLRVCDYCSHIEEIPEGKHLSANCKSCGNVYIKPIDPVAIQFPRMLAQRRMRITAEEEERSKGGYKIISSYTKSKHANCQQLVTGGKTIANLTFERTARFRHINLGAQRDYKEGNIGFNLDLINRVWVSKDINELAKYIEEKKLKPVDIAHHLCLLTDSKNDVITFEVADSITENTDGYGLTLVNVLLQSICNVLNLDESEIRGFYQPIKDQNGRIIIFETSEGGTGTLSSIVKNEDLIRKIAAKALDILHFDKDGNDIEGACARSCYNCICNFYNQRNHSDFDRNLVKDLLIQLASFEAFKKDQDNSILYDDYLKDSKTTSLEKEVLTRLHNLGVAMPAEIHKIIYYKEELVIEADFYFEPRLCVLIDGPDHDKKHIQDDDARKRKRLKMLNYRYLVIHHGDIDQGIGGLLSDLGIGEDQFKTWNFNGFIYLDIEKKNLAEGYFTALKKLFECHSFEFVDNGVYIKGSWIIDQIKYVFKSIGKHFEPDDAIRKIKHAVELAKIQKVQSEINKNNFEAASSFLNSTKEFENICTFMGSLAIVKHGADLKIIELSTDQMMYLEDNPHLKINPGEFLNVLKGLN